MRCVVFADTSSKVNNCSWTLSPPITRNNRGSGGGGGAVPCSRKNRIWLGRGVGGGRGDGGGGGVGACGTWVLNHSRCANGMWTDGDQCVCEEGECLPIKGGGGGGSSLNESSGWRRYTYSCPGAWVSPSLSPSPPRSPSLSLHTCPNRRPNPHPHPHPYSRILDVRQ